MLNASDKEDGECELKQDSIIALLVMFSSVLNQELRSASKGLVT